MRAGARRAREVEPLFGAAFFFDAAAAVLRPFASATLFLSASIRSTTGASGTGSGFDIQLLRAVTSALKIGVIASGGAGRLEDFRDAIESGGARAVLAASLFHDRVLSVGEVKRYLAEEGIPVR